MSQSSLSHPSPNNPYAPFRIRDYRLLMATVFMLAFIYLAQGVAIGWDLYERTGSALALGMVGLLQFAPVILLFLPAGQLADRHDRRSMMALSLLVWIAGSGSMTLGSLWSADGGALWIYIGAAINSAAMTLNRPARDSVLPRIVPAELLAKATSWNASLYQIAAVLGPAVAGGLIALTHSATTVYALNALCGVASLLCVLAMRPLPEDPSRRSLAWGEMFGGLRHVWQTKIILGLMIADLFAVLLGGATALLPVFAKDILQVGAGGLGWLSAAPAVGAALAAAVQSHLPPQQRPGVVFFLAVAMFGAATAAFGLSTSYWLSFLLLVIIGASDIVAVVIRHTVIQLYTPDELRGRVSSVARVFVSSSNELGAFESGLLASFTTPVFTVVFGGLATISVVIACWRAFPEARNMPPLGKA